ncbi:MAG: glutamyl-tRNA reductase [Gammaproteobacteria bacterium]|nr:glutamyl-tRNA reductase [Gammaproteobacteria bacterium]MBT8105545.1 glutamyl-tRNA reductase [Gammaproteobacteria bacterium]NNF50332.1 glutamyl-tRNA reductase [Woeseiaceae bacterium]NNK25559.1 glutamyl-tRNA reductase [Woeseiaceae bacterium]NNL64132.1 glutamyl-tRNA reductase [Woeseiaceae bacterium]
MPLQILGLNHNTAPVEIRERVAYAGDQVGDALQRLVSFDAVDEAVLLSTCNRTEIYAVSDDGGREQIREWLSTDRGLGDAIDGSLFTLDDEDAIRHIFRVACGLDSMVLGEPQILGQLKDAFRHAQGVGTIGGNLSRLFQHTFAVAKKVRTDTEIGASPVSVASAAVHLAQQFFAGFKRHTALLVGAGVTIELVAKHLVSNEIGRLFVANRSIERAQELAGQFGGFALPLSEIEGTLPEADILITSTAATEPVVTAAQVEAAIKARRRKPIFACDIAVPRDIEAAAGDLADFYLYTIDDLDRVILENQGSREAAAVEAHRLLDDEIRRYMAIERSKQVAPFISTLRESHEAVRKQVAKKARRRMARGESAEDAIEFATASLMKKMLHRPSVALRKAGEQSDAELIAAARKLFGLDET